MLNRKLRDRSQEVLDGSGEILDGSDCSIPILE
jgi:hypothetical protein